MRKDVGNYLSKVSNQFPFMNIANSDLSHDYLHHVPKQDVISIFEKHFQYNERVIEETNISYIKSKLPIVS